ncbi:hypothetical protein Tco_1142833 [Tanacetum coccineum]
MLESIKRQVDPLMKEAVSLVGRSRNLWQSFPEPPRQRQFEGIIIGFIRDQEEELRQLEEYMNIISDEFMRMTQSYGGAPEERHLAPKPRISWTKSESLEYLKVTRIKDSTTPSRTFQIQSGPVVDWAFFTQHGLVDEFFQNINRDAFSGPHWVNLFQINEPVYRESTREFFASFEFKDNSSRTNPVGLYSEDFASDDQNRWTLQNALTVKKESDWKGFWPNIGNGGFVVGSTVVKKIRDPRVRLAHHFLAMTISGPNSSTQRITAIDMFYLYCIYAEGVVCNILYWLAKYLKRARDMSVLCGGVFVTRIARSFGLLSMEMVDALSIEPKARTFTKKSLITIGVIMELDWGNCYWPTTQGFGDDDKEEEDVEAKEPARAYRDISRGDWQER